MMVSMSHVEIKQLIFHDIAHFGVRLVVGLIFILHSTGKFQDWFLEFLASQGIPVELQIPIALAELVPGIFLIIGVLSRISGAILCVIMLGAIFVINGVTSITGDGGIEFDLILLASCLVIITIGPGKISLSYLIKKIPRYLQ